MENQKLTLEDIKQKLEKVDPNGYEKHWFFVNYSQMIKLLKNTIDNPKITINELKNIFDNQYLCEIK